MRDFLIPYAFQKGDKVRLLRNASLVGRKNILPAGRELYFAGFYSIQGYDRGHQFSFVSETEEGLAQIAGLLPIDPNLLARVEEQPKPVNHGFNCKGGRDSWENLTCPYLQNESNLSDCQVDDAEAAVLAKLRAKKLAALPFYLEAPADRRGEVHHFVDSESIIEKASKVSSADKEIVEKGRGTRKYGLRGIFEFEGNPYAIMGGCYGPEYRVADGWYLLRADDPLAAKVVTTGRLCPETAYHSFRARYKGIEYIMVGPEHQFIFERVKGSYRAVLERLKNWRREKNGQ